jgi:hypothetical protein
MEQPVEREIQVDLVSGVAYVERHCSSEAPTHITDIARPKESKRHLIKEELRIRVVSSNSIEKISGIWAPRENGSLTPVACSILHWGLTEFEKECYSLKDPNYRLTVA